jgi:hypothetical protein
MALLPVLYRIKRQAEGPRELGLGHLQAAAYFPNVDARNDSYSHRGCIAFDGGQSLPSSLENLFSNCRSVDRFCFAMSNALFAIGLESL